MKLENIINELRLLRFNYRSGSVNLNNYCDKKNLSYTSTSRILNKCHTEMTLQTAYNILGLTAERNISQVILRLKIKDIKSIKSDFENDFI